MPEKRLKLYGTGWCPKSAKLRNYLQSLWMEFDDLNVETDEAAAQAVKDFYNGELKFPTLAFGTDFLKNPSITQINTFLEKHGLKA